MDSLRFILARKRICTQQPHDFRAEQPTVKPDVVWRMRPMDRANAAAASTQKLMREARMLRVDAESRAEKALAAAKRADHAADMANR